MEIQYVQKEGRQAEKESEGENLKMILKTGFLRNMF
jgi:hypothetical protein